MYNFGFSDESTAKFGEALDEITSNVKEIEAAAIVSVEGLPIASKLPDNYESTIIAAMTAAMLSLGERIANNFSKGTLSQIIVEGVNGYVMSTSAGPNAVLTVSATKDAKLGLLFHEMSKTAQKIEALLGSE